MNRAERKEAEKLYAISVVAQAQLEGVSSLVDVLVRPPGGGPGPIVGMEVSQMLAILERWLHVHNASQTFVKLEAGWRSQWLKSNPAPAGEASAHMAQYLLQKCTTLEEYLENPAERPPILRMRHATLLQFLALWHKAHPGPVGDQFYARYLQKKWSTEWRRYHHE